MDIKITASEIWVSLLRQDAQQAARNIMVTGQQGDLLGVLMILCLMILLEIMRGANYANFDCMDFSILGA